MIFFRLALRNVVRHRVRSLITLSTIAFGCVSLIFIEGYFEDTFYKMRESYIKAHTGHLQIYRRGYMEGGQNDPFDFLIDRPQDIIPVIKSVSGVKTVTARLEFSGLLSKDSNSIPCFGQGVEPHIEKGVRPKDIHSAKEDPLVLGGVYMEEGEPLSDDSPHEIILGKGLAEDIAAKVGDSLTLMAGTVGGSINAWDVIVRGIFITSSKEFDDFTLKMPLQTTKRLLRTESAQSLVVFLDRTDDTQRIKKELGNIFKKEKMDLEVKSWRDLSDFYVKTEDLFGRLFIILKIILGIIIVLSVYNTMSMAVMERVSEVGTMMAMGTKRRSVLLLFLCEGALLGIIGGFLGVILGSLITYLVGKIGIPMPPPPNNTLSWVSEPMVVPGIILFSLLFSIVCAVLSSVFPGIRASRFQIADALRYTN